MRWLVICVLGLAAPANSIVPVSGASRTAVVGTDSAEFFFPVSGLKDAWEWSKRGTAPNALEYGWTVEVVLEGATYRISAQKFKPAAVQAGRGSFAELTHKLQSDVWKVSPGGDYEPEQFAVPVRAYAEPGGLLIRVGVPRFLERFRTSAPKTVVFRTEGSSLPATRIEVPVTYREAR